MSEFCNKKMCKRFVIREGAALFLMVILALLVWNVSASTGFPPSTSDANGWVIIVTIIMMAIAFLLGLIGCLCLCHRQCRCKHTIYSENGDIIIRPSRSDTIPEHVQMPVSDFDPDSPFAFTPPDYETLDKEPPKYCEIFTISNGEVPTSSSPSPPSFIPGPPPPPEPSTSSSTLDHRRRGRNRRLPAVPGHSSLRQQYPRSSFFPGPTQSHPPSYETHTFSDTSNISTELPVQITSSTETNISVSNQTNVSVSLSTETDTLNTTYL